MNKYIAIVVSGLLLAACQQDTNKTKVNKDGAEQEKKISISEKDKTSYAIGVDMATTLIKLNNNFATSKLDFTKVQKGFADKAANKVALSDEEIQKQLETFRQDLVTAKQEKQKAQLARKTADNARFFETLDAKGFTKTSSGLYYKVLSQGKKGAIKPSATDKVRVHYTGTFTDGRQFDSSVGKASFSFSLLGGVIKGWIEAVQLMPVGSKYQFVIPPELGYGNADHRSIPAGSILLFEIELLEIVEKNSNKNM